MARSSASDPGPALWSVLRRLSAHLHSTPRMSPVGEAGGSGAVEPTPSRMDLLRRAGRARIDLDRGVNREEL